MNASFTPHLSHILEEKDYDKIIEIVLYGEPHLICHVLKSLELKSFERNEGRSFRKIFQIALGDTQSSNCDKNTFALNTDEIKCVALDGRRPSKQFSERRMNQISELSPKSEQAWDDVVTGGGDKAHAEGGDAGTISQSTTWSQGSTSLPGPGKDNNRKIINRHIDPTGARNLLAPPTTFNTIFNSSRRVIKSFNNLFSSRSMNVKATLNVIPNAGACIPSIRQSDAETIAVLYIFDLRDLRALEIIDIMMSRVGCTKSFKPLQEYLVAISVPQCHTREYESRSGIVYESMDTATEQNRWEFAQDVCMDAGAELIEVLDPRGPTWVKQLMHRVVTKSLFDMGDEINYRRSRCTGCFGSRTKKSTNIIAIG